MNSLESRTAQTFQPTGLETLQARGAGDVIKQGTRYFGALTALVATGLAANFAGTAQKAGAANETVAANTASFTLETQSTTETMDVSHCSPAVQRAVNQNGASHAESEWSKYFGDPYWPNIKGPGSVNAELNAKGKDIAEKMHFSKEVMAALKAAPVCTGVIPKGQIWQVGLSGHSTEHNVAVNYPDESGGRNAYYKIAIVKGKAYVIAVPGCGNVLANVSEVPPEVEVTPPETPKTKVIIKEVPVTKVVTKEVPVGNCNVIVNGNGNVVKDNKVCTEETIICSIVGNKKNTIKIPKGIKLTAAKLIELCGKKPASKAHPKTPKPPKVNIPEACVPGSFGLKDATPENTTDSLYAATYDMTPSRSIVLAGLQVRDVETNKNDGEAIGVQKVKGHYAGVVNIPGIDSAHPQGKWVMADIAGRDNDKCVAKIVPPTKPENPPTIILVPKSEGGSAIPPANTVTPTPGNPNGTTNPNQGGVAPNPASGSTAPGTATTGPNTGGSDVKPGVH